MPENSAPTVSVTSAQVGAPTKSDELGIRAAYEPNDIERMEKRFGMHTKIATQSLIF